MDKNTQNKLVRLQDLLKRKADIERDISAILAPDKVASLPPSISVNNEVLKMIAEAGTKGISVTDLVKQANEKWPNTGIDRSRVASSLAYLKNEKKQVEIIGRGVYRVLISGAGSENPSST